MNIKTQCCGIILLLIIWIFYGYNKKIKLITAKAFKRLFWSDMICLVLDVLSILFLAHHDILPDLVINLACKAYLVSLVILGMSAYLYICTDIYGGTPQYGKRQISAGIEALAGIILILVLPIYKSYDKPSAYTHGASVILTYVFCVYFLSRVILLLIIQKKKIDRRRRDAMYVWILLWLVAAAIQFVNNELLVVGFASTVGMIIIFLKLENPELNIDKSTGMFNPQGMLLYMHQLLKNGNKFALIDLVLPDSISVCSIVEESNVVRVEVISYLMNIQDAYVFKNTENEVVLIFEDEKKAESYRNILKKRFESGWGKLGNTFINPKWIYMPDGSMVDRADDVTQLLEYAKANGSNYMEDDTVMIRSRMLDAMYEEKKTELLIMEALEHDRLDVFYQPIYSTKKQRIVSAEALVRIRDREDKLIPPGIFIPVAEKNGSIVKLGEAVFEKVCCFIRDFKPEQYGIEYIEVNLSVVQCAYEQLAGHYINIMEKYSISPKMINLEITESASAESKKILLDNMNTLIDYGIHFSLDDFGTGESNLNYIVEMPVDIVKFDRSMTVSYFESKKAKYVMDAAIRMIHGMKLDIVSEGIETREQFETMVELGISYVQGYYFSKPLSEQEFLDFIRP